MKIEDILAPYQYDHQNPPLIIQAANVEINWAGTKLPAILARIKMQPESSGFYDVWRLEGDDGAWCLAGAMVPHSMDKIWSDRETNIKTWVGQIHTTIGYKSFCRLFFHKELGQYVSVNSRFGTFYKSFGRPVTSFYLKWENIKLWQCSATKSAFDAILQDRESDAFLAQRLYHLPETIHKAMALGFDDELQYHRHLERLESLVTSALWNSDLIWDLHDDYRVNISARDISDFPLSHVITLSNPAIRHKGLSRKDVYWLNLIKHLGPLDISFKRLRKHYCLQQNITLISFPVSAPNSHQKLEAKLKLLEWAKAHLPDEKYAQVEAMEQL